MVHKATGTQIPIHMLYYYTAPRRREDDTVSDFLRSY